jgi:hypothetical protein
MPVALGCEPADEPSSHDPGLPRLLEFRPSLGGTVAAVPQVGRNADPQPHAIHHQHLTPTHRRADPARFQPDRTAHPWATVGVAQLDPAAGALERPALRRLNQRSWPCQPLQPGLMIASTCPSVTSPVSGVATSIAVRGSNSSTGTCSVVASEVAWRRGDPAQPHRLVVRDGRPGFRIEVSGKLHSLGPPGPPLC